MSQKPKVVIVEDEPSINEMYRLKFEFEGFEVRSAFNGQEGLQIIDDFKPLVVLLDLKMPVMSGEDMLEKLRSTDAGSDVRVIVLTNISRDEAPHKLRFLNVDRYMVKAHHTPSQVVDVVKQILNIK